MKIYSRYLWQPLTRKTIIYVYIQASVHLFIGIVLLAVWHNLLIQEGCYLVIITYLQAFPLDALPACKSWQFWLEIDGGNKQPRAHMFYLLPLQLLGQQLSRTILRLGSLSSFSPQPNGSRPGQAARSLHLFLKFLSPLKSEFSSYLVGKKRGIFSGHNPTYQERQLLLSTCHRQEHILFILVQHNEAC